MTAGDPQGLIGSHNFIESDSSNTRDDIYVTGNNHKLNMDKFMSWYNMSTDGTFDMDLMAKRAKLRFDETVQSNPNFYYDTYCARCRKRFPVGEYGEFVWEGTDERVGT